MPPRIQSRRVSTNSVLPYVSSPCSSSSSTVTIRTPPSTPCCCRTFTSTPTHQTRQRLQMFQWLDGPGRILRDHQPGVPKYIGNLRDLSKPQVSPDFLPKKPFLWNPQFTSETILSQELKDEIVTRVIKGKQGIRAVSIQLKVDTRRVAAVVRLAALERKWRDEGKQLALPYARAVHEMVPTTPYDGYRVHPHESINDLPVHSLTDAQIFYPVSESRHFTRLDAGRVFSGAPRLEKSEAEAHAKDPDAAIYNITHKPSSIEHVGKGEDEQQVLQPADVRIPHPYLITHERNNQHRPDEQRENNRLFNLRLAEEEQSAEKRKQDRKQRADSKTQKVAPTDSRFEFRIKDVVVSKETTGVDGRGAKALGRRYGVPSEERKKGQVKIPTSVRV